MSETNNNHQNVAQLIDANLDRAREGIRVIEDWCRFGLKRKDLVITLKNCRQKLGANHKDTYKEARSIHADPGVELGHPLQAQRHRPLKIVFANCARAQEALRVIEEFSRESNHQLSKISSEIRYELYEVEKEILKTSHKNSRQDLLQKSKVCLIATGKTNIINTVSSAIRSGITMVQYRSKTGTDARSVREAKELATICKEHKSLFIVNDRIDIALAAGADGVHLGQEDFPFNEARRILGESKLLGVSTHSIKQAKEAENQGWDYIGVGPIFESKSKLNMQPIGLKALKEISDCTRLPSFAIGGINESNIDEVISNGATRIAVINAIINAKDAASASKSLLQKLK